MGFLLFLIGIFCHFAQITAQANYCKSALFTTISSNDVSVTTRLLSTFHSVSEVACAQHCLRNSKCKYRKYRTDTNRCELLQSISKKDIAETSVISKRIEEFCADMPKHTCDKKCRCADSCDMKRYRCDCSGQGVYRTCREALQANNNKTQNYWIQASEYRGAAQIKCMWNSTTRQSFAAFNHDTEAEVRVTGYPDSAGAYQRDFIYLVDMATIISIINQSDHCQQFTSARCKGLYFVTRKATWLKGRNGQRLKFWGGGPSNGTGCACGITNTCVNTAYKCHCDINDDYNYYKDEGNVVDRSVLPITGIAVGDTARTGVEVLNYHVGPLFCHF